MLISLKLSRQMFRPIDRLHRGIGEVVQNNLDVFVSASGHANTLNFYIPLQDFCFPGLHGKKADCCASRWPTTVPVFLRNGWRDAVFEKGADVTWGCTMWTPF